MALLGACSHKENTNNSYSQYLGEIDYESPQVAMVIETIEDEEVPGVVYRNITDLSGILNQTEIPVCVFFYSGNATDKYGVFAGVEEIAERLNGRVLMLGIDIMQHRELVDGFGLVAVPDFVLIKKGVQADAFKAANYEYWTMTDVYNWLVLNQI
ncbi:MAG: hypothetical protein MJ166_05760 [Clostridia bacterium]|nr:hypothetical protein [Clostridia bacterium]